MNFQVSQKKQNHDRCETSGEVISPSSPRPLTGVSSQPRNEATLSFRASVAALHAANCVLGDVNESNMLVVDGGGVAKGGGMEASGFPNRSQIAHRACLLLRHHHGFQQVV